MWAFPDLPQAINMHENKHFVADYRKRNFFVYYMSYSHNVENFWLLCGKLLTYPHYVDNSYKRGNSARPRLNNNIIYIPIPYILISTYHNIVYQSITHSINNYI